jgi:hypothetical protein
MKKLVVSAGVAMILSSAIISCKKSASTADPNAITSEEKNLVMKAGFNENWVERTPEGNFRIENDIVLTRTQLEEYSQASPSNNLVIADEEHYRTYNTVAVPSSGARNITVRLGAGFPAYYTQALQNVVNRYNSYNLRITFSIVSSGGDIVINAANLGTSGGGCILGQAAGFPDANGNPSPGFTLSNSSCALSYLNTVDKADEVMAHEIGHCIGFRHTDYKRRASCGPGAGESAGTIGAVWIPGTPQNVSGSYNSWMMACVNGSPVFNADDKIALEYVY